MTKSEFSNYQTKIIPEDFYIKLPCTKASRPQESYWHYAYAITGTDLSEYKAETEDSFKIIDEYWLQVFRSSKSLN